MAHLWRPDSQHAWHPASLEGTSVAFEEPGGGPAVQLCRCGEQESQWAVMAPPGTSVRVNGQAVVAGLRVLSDRDEVVVAHPGREPLQAFFSTERLACVELFSGSEATLRCPRCKQPVVKDVPAVRCPACGAWHHQIPEGHEGHTARKCWTYSDHCALCPQPTALGSGFQWTPEGL